ncbi:hypothetical protein Dimus_005218, partial [Dionaea muscipula]
LDHSVMSRTNHTSGRRRGRSLSDQGGSHNLLGFQHSTRVGAHEERLTPKWYKEHGESGDLTTTLLLLEIWAQEVSASRKILENLGFNDEKVKGRADFLQRYLPKDKEKDDSYDEIYLLGHPLGYCNEHPVLDACSRSPWGEAIKADMFEFSRLHKFDEMPIKSACLLGRALCLP